jgi:prolyl-tRNA editing enzyme YbaK/EbsC (Cys-tRNA(Pro) deacylase)
VWPPEVERIAAPLRAAGIEARLEELPPGEEALPGTGARTVAYACNGRIVVVLVPVGREPDARKVATVAGCEPVSRVEPPPFPFAAAARVLLEQRLLAVDTLWLRAGSARHVLGLEPSVLVRLTRAVPADLIQNG